MTNTKDFIYQHRVVPRLMLFGYALLLVVTLNWYLDFPLEFREETNAELVSVLITSGKSPNEAVALATKRVEVIGRPHGYTALLSAMFAAAPFVFGVYVNGRVENESEHSIRAGPHS
jgi:hypothetical protein